MALCPVRIVFGSIEGKAYRIAIEGYMHGNKISRDAVIHGKQLHCEIYGSKRGEWLQGKACRDPCICRKAVILDPVF